MYIEKILVPEDVEYLPDINVGAFTTYQIGGKSLGVFITKRHESYIKLIHNLSTKFPYRILGKGSNLLIDDQNQLDFFIITGKYRNIKIFKEDKKLIVFVTPFTELQFFIKFLISNGISAYEELAGIPATIGGAVFNNAGIKNLEISKYLKKITFFNRKKKEIKTIPSNDKLFSYRNSFFKEETLNGNCLDLVSFVFEFPLENLKNPEILKEKYLNAWKSRAFYQPLNEKSCGSIFKNPPDTHAWKIIDSLGFRGYTKGGAKVSEKHTNFIINFNHAKFSDIFHIINKIKQKASEQKIYLEEEVEIWK